MLIVFNPTAGRRRRRQLDRALDALRLHGITFELRETLGPAHATALAREAARQGAPLVVAAGGDGTIAEVASGLMDQGCSPSTALGILPLGTANVLAWELGIPMMPEAAAAIFAGRRRVLLHPGVVHDGQGGQRLFVQMLGAGFDAAVCTALPLPLKRAIGKGAYVWQSMASLPAYPFTPIEVSLDGGSPQRAASVIVSKGRLYAGRFCLAPEARPTEPGFHVAIFEEHGRAGSAALAALAGAALPLGLLPRLPGMSLHRAQSVEMRGAGVPAQMDGDKAGLLPCRIESAGRALPVMVG
ncbi:diacylglycerol kinase family lipid kinase [Acetobacteraceae bacterium H6797]|nr:diacylglycerol kinase family lipid kinase [Acetobacteraceae bacterium H6797]